VTNEYVTVIMPIFNQIPLAVQALQNVRDFTPRPLKIICVDNASDEPIQPLADWLGPEHDVIRLTKNFGPYVAMNEGLERADSELVILLCTDTYVLPRWWVPCEGALRAQHLGWVSPEERTGPYHPRLAWDALRAGYLPEYEVVQEFKSSVGLLDWKRLKETVGYFSDAYFLVFGDTQFVERMNDAGIKAGWVRGAYCQHLGSQSRRLTGIDTDVSREIQDAQTFVAEYKDRPDVLARHPGVELYLPENAAHIRAMKAARWEQP